MLLPPLLDLRGVYPPLRGLARAYHYVSGAWAVAEDPRGKATLAMKLVRQDGPRKGTRIMARQAADRVLVGRGDQVGMRRAQLSVFPQKGLAEGTRQPELRIEIAWLRHQERSSERFMKNVRNLARRLAKKSDQVEVMVEWDLPRKRGRVEAVTLARAPH